MKQGYYKQLVQFRSRLFVYISPSPPLSHKRVVLHRQNTSGKQLVTGILRMPVY